MNWRSACVLYIWWFSVFALFLEDYLTYKDDESEWSSAWPQIKVGHFDLYFMAHWFFLISWRLFEIWKWPQNKSRPQRPIFHWLCIFYTLRNGSSRGIFMPHWALALAFNGFWWNFPGIVSMINHSLQQSPLPAFPHDAICLFFCHFCQQKFISLQILYCFRGILVLPWLSDHHNEVVLTNPFKVTLPR